MSVILNSFSLVDAYRWKQWPLAVKVSKSAPPPNNHSSPAPAIRKCALKHLLRKQTGTGATSRMNL